MNYFQDRRNRRAVRAALPTRTGSDHGPEFAVKPVRSLLDQADIEPLHIAKKAAR